jgi:tRNA pseudouridine38/39 synthase
MDQATGACGQAMHHQRQAHFASLASRLRALADEAQQAAAAAAATSGGGGGGSGLPPEHQHHRVSALSAELRALAEQAPSTAVVVDADPSEEEDAVRQRLERLVHGQAAAAPPTTTAAAAAKRSSGDSGKASKKAKKGAAARQYDARKYGARRVLLEIAYMGERYRGFARQTPSEAKRAAAAMAAAATAAGGTAAATPPPPSTNDDDNDGTVEGALFSALRRVCLAPPGADPVRALGYSRCGRTDRGVSALGQVVALTLRSAGPPPPRPPPPPPSGGDEGGDTEQQQPPLAAATDPLPLTPAALLPPPEQEIDYPAMLNRALPPDVRVLGWADPPAVIGAAGGGGVGGGNGDAPDVAGQPHHRQPLEFDARFSASYREYLYFFASPHLPGAGAFDLFSAGGGGGGRGGGGGGQAPGAASAGASAAAVGAPVALDVTAMDEAARHLEGEHDFRAFCKVDMSGHVKHFVRRVLSARVEPAGAAYSFDAPGGGGGGAGGGGGDRDPLSCPPNHHRHHQTFALRIRGTAFLYHQVRCIAAVLLMVGQGLERAEVVAELLDVARRPRKPQYSLAPEQPLLLYACGYEAVEGEEEGEEGQDGGSADGVVAAAGEGGGGGNGAASPSGVLRPLACAAPIRWHRSARAVQAAEASLGALLQSHLVGAAMAGAMLDRVRRDAGGSGQQPQQQRQPQHVPLLERPCEPSLEERFTAQGIPTEGLSRKT